MVKIENTESSKKGNSVFLSKSNSYVSVNSGDISYNQFPSSTRSCPQNLGHHLSIISEEIEALDKIINQNHDELELMNNGKVIINDRINKLA